MRVQSMFRTKIACRLIGGEKEEQTQNQETNDADERISDSAIHKAKGIIPVQTLHG